ncbi:His-Xaa-Ser system radical SAM maturase HxsC [Flavobacterium sp. UBA6046]|jgi:His-Xaa-Ser system radical SAM maturase HxsC|uniref:His-Xaa-Ser system radical SAM maturase HxsC n=1 Tax=Flavobacterium sp. UBA6046 TaxID=1946552 RepID=UPI0025B91944|nr:His-Xaa-Ser system radical SAM maturase HxsC [Flavobacterium sp. UBA6046]
MLLKTKGKPVQIHEPIVGRVSRNSASKVHEILIAEDYLPLDQIGNFKAVLTNLDTFNLPLDTPLIHGVTTFDHLADDDIISISPSGLIQTIYRVASHQNFILATERCNSNCLMCSQPPKDRQDIYSLYNIHQKMIPLIPKNCPEIGITGGEPTLMGSLFFDMLAQIKSELPNTEIHCLTNGRSFAWKNIADRLAELELSRLMLGIPIYSDYYQIHDYIVQANCAFNQTIQGLYNLAVNNQRIEIRVVLQKQSIGRLVKLAKYIYQNLPFVEHITFMGLEYQGYTPFNIDKLWVDPVDYMEELGEACEYLSDRKMNVSIYNSQLCIVPQYLWKYCRKSISDWKNIYLEECSKCSANKQCGGLFASSQKMHSNYIKAIL